MYTHVIHTIPIPNSNPFNNNDNEQQLRCCIPTTSCQCNEPPESTVTRHSLFVTLYFPLLVARYSLLFVIYLSRIAFILFVALLLPAQLCNRLAISDHVIRQLVSFQSALTILNTHISCQTIIASGIL